MNTSSAFINNDIEISYTGNLLRSLMIPQKTPVIQGVLKANINKNNC